MSTPQPALAPPAWFKTFAGWVAFVRRALAFGLVLVAVYYLYGDHIARVCHDELAGEKVMKVCSPMGATDPRVGLWLLTLVLLLLPDLSEIEIGGVLKLRRVVEETKQEAETLRGELADIRTSAAAAAQAGAVSGADAKASVSIDLSRSVDAFLDDVDSGDTGALSPAEERGAFAQLAFTAGLAGLIPQFFSAWEKDAFLFGWMLSQDGEFVLTHTVPDIVPAGLVDAVEEQFDVRTARDGETFLIGSPEDYFVTAYAFSDPDLGGKRHLLGAFGVEISKDPTQIYAYSQGGPTPLEGFDVSEIDTLRASVASAAAVYGLMLTQLLGERPTLWGLAAGGSEHV